MESSIVFDFIENKASATIVRRHFLQQGFDDAEITAAINELISEKKMATEFTGGQMFFEKQ